MRLSISHVSQRASDGSCDVNYEVDFKLNDGPEVTVSVANTVPDDADAKLIEQARNSIRDGFLRVLRPRSIGADVVVYDLTIHELDVRTGQYAKSTADELEQFVRDALTAEPISPERLALRALLWLLVALPLLAVGLIEMTPRIVSTIALLLSGFIIVFRFGPPALITVVARGVNQRTEGGNDGVTNQ